MNQSTYVGTAAAMYAQKEFQQVQLHESVTTVTKKKKLNEIPLGGEIGTLHIGFMS